MLSLGQINKCAVCAHNENRGQNLELKIKANDKTDFGFSPKRQQALVIKGILNSSRRRGIDHYNERRMYFFPPCITHPRVPIFFQIYSFDYAKQ